MRNYLLTRVLAAVTVLMCLAAAASAQKAPRGKAAAAKPQVAQRVTQVDLPGLKKILKPNGKPLLVNFWATWCDPCRDEFPDIVKLDGAYHGKIDVITISLDDPKDIMTFVPKFLTDMKAEMPAYLLHTDDEDAAIKLISDDWAGNLPMTVVYDTDGKVAYMRNGRIFYLSVAESLDKLLKLSPAK
jgi:thiol-disulfide isomerase/thioredoxin